MCKNISLHIPDYQRRYQGIEPVIITNIEEPMIEEPKEKVNHPSHYGGEDNPYEAIKVIEAWNAGFNLGNCIKYICRVLNGNRGRTAEKNLEDLRKVRWYLDRAIKNLEETIGGLI